MTQTEQNLRIVDAEMALLRKALDACRDEINKTIALAERIKARAEQLRRAG